MKISVDAVRCPGSIKGSTTMKGAVRRAKDKRDTYSLLAQPQPKVWRVSESLCTMPQAGEMESQSPEKRLLCSRITERTEESSRKQLDSKNVQDPPL